MGDGWFHTGDAAVLHPDGYVEIRDRIKDVIISGGENISSVEVEGVLLRHPAVQEVAILPNARQVSRQSPHAFAVFQYDEGMWRLSAYLTSVGENRHMPSSY